MKRFCIIRPGAKSWLCMVAASDSKSAIRAARTMFDCPPGTQAVEVQPSNVDLGGGARITVGGGQ